MNDAESPRQPSGHRFEPPRTWSANAGQVRQVGVEIEFMGVGVSTSAEALCRALGGAVVEEDPQSFAVRGTSLGNLTVELDTRYVHPGKHGRSLPVHLGRRSAAWLGVALSRVVPRELVVAPLPPERLGLVDQAVAVLRAAGARGRGTSWLGSLGLHFNVDPPSLEVDTLLGYLRAFLLLEPWLRRETFRAARWRRGLLLPAEYPAGYVRRVLAPDYRPDLAGFADDYLKANPTRDRALDLLPVLLHLDKARVRARLPFEKIGPRPALHYRLPWAQVGAPKWSILPDWQRWLAVERLAGDPVRLEALSLAFLRFAGSTAQWGQRAGEPGCP
ncbi:amidoligase family protein [Geminicoccus roseus]|uniref:amidoligase family protein n=1 Tax=Geminicoccus roseus TaxID=404900 RepID=UPI000A017063|nr:amidoligase family protein [Geminicoccus roseus]